MDIMSYHVTARGDDTAQYIHNSTQWVEEEGDDDWDSAENVSMTEDGVNVGSKCSI